MDPEEHTTLQPFFMKPLPSHHLSDPSNRNWMDSSGLWQPYNLEIAPAKIEVIRDFIESYGTYGGKLNGQMIDITPALVSQALRFPCEGYDALSIRGYDSKALDSYFFPSGKGSRKGYDISQAKDPAFKDLLSFMCDRIFVKTASKPHLSAKLCFAGFRIRWSGLKFNWSAFICEKILKEINAIKDGKRVQFIKYAHYLTMILEYCTQPYGGKASNCLKSEEKQSIVVAKVNPVVLKQCESGNTKVVRETLPAKKPEFIYVCSEEESEAEAEAQALLARPKRPKIEADYDTDDDFMEVRKELFGNLLKKPSFLVVQESGFSKKTQGKHMNKEQECESKEEKKHSIMDEKDEKLKNLEKQCESLRRKLFETTQELASARGEIVDLSKKISAECL